MRLRFEIEIVVFSKPGLGARKSGLAEAFNRPNLTFAVSPKYLSNETKICIFITRIPRRVYIILGGFFKNFIFFQRLRRWTTGQSLQPVMTGWLKRGNLFHHCFIAVFLLIRKASLLQICYTKKACKALPYPEPTVF